MTIDIAPDAERTSVRHAEASDIERLARALTLAFYDDPAFRWFWPRESVDRFGRIERYFRRLTLPATLPHGAVYTTGTAAGAAMWLPPGKGRSTAWESLRMLPWLASVSGRDLLQFLRGIALMEKHHPREDHWYLWLLGVAPEWQGTGVGSELMRPILDRCDAEGIPAYLEATSPRNCPFYERHGFVVTRELVLPDGPPMWAMWREPR